MFAVQGNSHGRREACCFQEKEETGPYADTAERCSPRASVSWRSSNRDEFWQWEICQMISTHEWLLLSQCKVSVTCAVIHFSTSTQTHWMLLFTILPFSASFLTPLIFPVNGRLTCHVWFNGEVVMFWLQGQLKFPNQFSPEDELPCPPLTFSCFIHKPSS